MNTMLEPLDEVDVTFSRPDTPEREASSVRLIERSTSSGPAPGYDVNTSI